MAVQRPERRSLTAVLPISVIGSRPLPDLVLTLVFVSSPLMVGGSVPAGVQLKNVGAADAGPHHAGIFLSTDATLSKEDFRIAFCEVSATTAPDATGVCGATYPLNPFVTAGTYYAIAAVDADGVVAESDESNNVAVMATTVVVN